MMRILRPPPHPRSEPRTVTLRKTQSVCSAARWAVACCASRISIGKPSRNVPCPPLDAQPCESVHTLRAIRDPAAHLLQLIPRGFERSVCLPSIDSCSHQDALRDIDLNVLFALPSAVVMHNRIVVDFLPGELIDTTSGGVCTGSSLNDTLARVATLKRRLFGG